MPDIERNSIILWGNWRCRGRRKSGVEPRVTRDIGHYRHRRFSRHRAGARVSVIEEPNAVLVRSRVPRTGAALARWGESSLGCARGPTTTAARAAALVSRGCSRGESGFAASPLAVAARTSFASPEVRSVRRGGRALAGGIEERKAAPRMAAARRLGRTRAGPVALRRTTLKTRLRKRCAVKQELSSILT